MVQEIFYLCSSFRFALLNYTSSVHHGGDGQIDVNDMEINLFRTWPNPVFSYLADKPYLYANTSFCKTTSYFFERERLHLLDHISKNDILAESLLFELVLAGY